MHNMKKIAVLLCSAVLCLHTAASAEVQRTEVGNVVSISSDYGYQDPQQLAVYTQAKLQQAADKKNGVKNKDGEQTKLVEPPALFRIYLNNDRFYKHKNSDKYTERIDISFTSHNLDESYVFDKEQPPYLIVNDGTAETALKFKKFKFDNPYWISFALTKQEIATLKNAQAVAVVLPQAQSPIYRYNDEKQRLEKENYNSSIKIIEMRYDLSDEVLAEWKQVLYSAQ